MSGPDHRQHPRIQPGAPVKASFSLQGRRFHDVEVVSLSAGGLGAWVEDRYFSLFEPGALLKNLFFESGDAPLPPPEAKVAFSTLKGQSARPGWIMFGAEYVQPSQAFIEAMERYVGAVRN